VVKRVLGVFLLVVIHGCALPRWPLDGTMTSPWGFRMMGWRPDFHRGVDIVVPTGTPVRAMKKGKVEFAGTQSGYGLVIVLAHGSTQTIYAHLSALHVKTGDTVEGRQVIGLSGATGNATGPHLHFEINRNGRSEDPVLLLGGAPKSLTRSR
jgi:murein DD-endopeptidase MepM/ murein hydrolase activator NlpD